MISLKHLCQVTYVYNIYRLKIFNLKRLKLAVFKPHSQIIA